MGHRRGDIPRESIGSPIQVKRLVDLYTSRVGGSIQAMNRTASSSGVMAEWLWGESLQVPRRKKNSSGEAWSTIRNYASLGAGHFISYGVFPLLRIVARNSA